MNQLSGVQTWLYDNLPVGVALLDREMRYWYSNAAFAAIQGTTPGQLLGRPLSQGPHDWVALVTRMAAQAQDTGRPVDEYNITLRYALQPSLERVWDISVLPVSVEDFDGLVIYLQDVTYRQRAERLSVSESRLRSVLEVAVEVILVVDENGTILSANPAATRLFQYTHDELVGMPVEIIMPSPSKEEHGRFMQRYLQTGVPHIIGTVREVWGQRKDGAVFPCELSIAESPEGAQRRIFVGVIRDISERKRAEQELRDESEFIAAILDTIGALVVVLDPDGRIVRINRAFEESSGYTFEELRGKRLVETLLLPEEVERVSSAFQYLVSDHFPNAFENFIVARNGELRLISWTNAVILDEHDNVGYVIGTGIDVTERRKAEDELRDARARLEAIIKTVALPLFVVDPAGRVILYNDAARRFFDGTIRQGKPLEITRLNPQTRAVIPTEEWPILRALREGREIGGVEQILVLPDGREVPILVFAAPVIVDERIVAAVGVNQDITALKAADRAKDEFLALITHELKSPLATIISWADLAVQEPEFMGEALPIIQRNARAQERIVSDLLDLSRIRYGKLSLLKEPVDAWEIALRTAEGRRRNTDEQGITLVLGPPPAPLPVLADPIRLAQVVDNLLTNAIKFTPSGGTITVEGGREGAMARISVSDTGRGIPPEQLPMIFQRFQQLGLERISGGLGLGLALVKGIIDLHGGRVEAHSAGNDKGATFTVWLPLRA